MSRHIPRHPERAAGLFDDPLNFELGFGGAGQAGPQMEQSNPLRRTLVECGLDQRVSRASQHAIDQKEIAETVGVKSLNSPSLYDAAHSNLLPAHGHGAAPGKNRTQELLPSSEFDSAPQPYGLLFQRGTRSATGAGAI
jgi:hypothetical protein